MIRKTIASGALAALIALPLVVGPTSASASCRGRANTGTVIGGVGGALLGNSISHGGGGAIIGGLGGAVVGHQIAKSGCRSSSHAYYSRSHTRYARSSNYHPAQRVYYDERGNPVGPGYGYPR
ncbi:MAG: hypothetical protein JWQ97_1329 [Phenylobacterium sp.]|nr:hypothetical protein [Phenylobacterium sp.]